VNLIVDAHEDLAWNILTFGRDYSQGALWIREREMLAETPTHNGNTLLGRPDWLLGHVGVIFATLFVAPERRRVGPWDSQCYATASEAYSLASAQLDAYSQLVEQHGQFKMIGSQADLAEVVDTWQDGRGLADRRIGLVPLMEGADPVLDPGGVVEWFERGVRIIGLAWESTRYAGGTHEPGPLTDDGKALLNAMASLGMILDLSHLSEEAYFEALDAYTGPVIASHANPRRFCPTTRGLSDTMIIALARRGGVIGVVPYNSFLQPGWQKGDPRQDVSIGRVADAIDHICQVTGSADHVGIGTDFDGGFGVEHVPAEIDTVADLQKLAGPLRERGFSDRVIEQIMHGNWLRMLRFGLPA
jgi:membrane dipeptidase